METRIARSIGTLTLALTNAYAQYRVKPVDRTLVPFLEAFAKAAALMLSLKEAALWSPIMFHLKDMEEYEDSDEYCPHCDNHYVLEAVEPKMRLEVEGEDARKDARMLKDERVKPKEDIKIWDDEGEAIRLG